ncbi:aminotransferase class I/II-fold pyridoxal phosphate-dependent enzyme [Arthrobacter crusticola]|uniref:Aminotransferase class I/II-fold pyridoxal phosphate-dependent enzyme n=1 Tax=Arthrobacter crusticola TaxID=2547960 RepID=A0A4R5U095_9MICC|nr:aminotransferase class I/II-fold pyridoxal phosphate-dependent enzyme [Arthrobacter crusticola]TDK26958.1 aminotransferase class I/II-fold pyridoxal phosphate-dependent enzyme [Arthrobacter crusticola]
MLPAAHARRVPVNQIREITQAAWATPHSIVLSIGEPGFPVARHVLEASMAALDRDETNYTPNAGIAPLREAFAARFLEHNGVAVDPSQVYVTAGAQQGLHLAMSTLLGPGDEVLIPNPGYPTYPMTAGLVHAVAVPYPLLPDNGFQPRIEDLEALVTPRTRMLVLNSPSNPLGAVFDADLTRALVDLARRQDLWILSDECYEAFTFDVGHVSPARFDAGGPGAPAEAGSPRVFTSLTLSKTYGLTGLRIGALVTPPGMEPLLNNIMEATVSCVSAPSQYGALAALSGPQDYVTDALAHYRKNRDAATAVLRKLNIPYLPAQGAFYLWADVSHASGGDVRAWVASLLETRGVALAPGTAFGSGGEGWVRIALCTDTDALVEGLSRLPHRKSS